METLKAIDNCPNCGAPLHGDECEYCGTAFTRKNEGIPIYDPYGNYVTTLFAKGILTYNEARKLCGLDSKQRADQRRKYIENQLKGPYAIHF